MVGIQSKGPRPVSTPSSEGPAPSSEGPAPKQKAAPEESAQATGWKPTDGARPSSQARGADHARAALASYSAQGQLVLNGIARQGFDEVVDPLAGVVSLVKGSSGDTLRLRVADAARAMEYERVALGTVVRDIREERVTLRTTGKPSWEQVDLMELAHQRLASPGFDVKAEATALRTDPDFVKHPLTLPDLDGKPTGPLSVATLDTWGQRVKSSTRWLTDSGTAKNLEFWRGLPVVKLMHQQMREVAHAPPGQREQSAHLANLRAGLQMAQGGTLAPVLEPSILAAGARAAGLKPDDDLKATCRALQESLAQGGLGALNAGERAALVALIGPPSSPGQALEKRLSDEHWKSFLRTMPQFVVETAVATAVVTATGGAAAAGGLGTAGVAVSGMVTGSALDGLLTGRTPTLKSLASGAVMGMAGGALGKVANGLAGTVLSKLPGNRLAGTVTAKLAGHALNAAATTSLTHFVSALKDGVPFSQNLAEDFLRTLVASSTSQLVSSQLAPRLQAAQQLVADEKSGPQQARDATAQALREARAARTEFSQKAKTVETLASTLALGPSETEAKRLAAQYLTATADLRASGDRLQQALGGVDAAASKLSPAHAKALMSTAQEWNGQLKGALNGLALGPNATPTTAPPQYKHLRPDKQGQLELHLPDDPQRLYKNLDSPEGRTRMVHELGKEFLDDIGDGPETKSKRYQKVEQELLDYVERADDPSRSRFESALGVMRTYVQDGEQIDPLKKAGGPGSYRELNKAIRESASMEDLRARHPEKAAFLLDQMVPAHDALPGKVKGMVFRGMTLSKAEVEQYTTGQQREFSQLAPMSASVSVADALSFMKPAKDRVETLMVIKSKTGKMVSWKDSAFGFEEEVMLLSKRGVKLKIDKAFMAPAPRSTEEDPPILYLFADEQ